MSIGSFLAGAGRIGAGIEQAQTDSELRRLQMEQAAAARAQMVRAEEERKQLQLARASGAGLPRVAGIFEPGQEQAAGPRPILDAIATAPAPIAAAPAAGVQTDTAPVVTAGPAAAPVTAAKTQPFVRKLGNVVVPMFDSRKPDRLNTSGVSGFGVISPNASQFERDRINSTNEARLDKLVRAMKVNTPLSGITKYFSPQDKKKAIENRENANTWYSSKQATTYFRATPEMIAVASKDPIGFHAAIMGYSKAAPEGGRWRGQDAPKAAAAQAGVAQAGVAPSGSKILANGFPKSYKDPAYDFVEQQAAAKVGVPVELLRAVRLAGEKTDADKISSAGARTPYQFIPPTRKGILEKYGVDAWSTPLNAATAAAYHLKESLDKGLSNEDALREYHGGPDRNKWGKVNDAYAARTMAFLGGAPTSGGEGSAQAGVQLAGSATQEPVLKLSSLNTYLTKPDKIVPAVADTLSQRDLVKREAEIYASSGNEAAYQQSVAKLQQIDANLIRLQGAQAIIDTQTFLDPSRAEKLISYLSNGELQVQMRADGRFAYFGRNQKGQMVPIPGQDNVSRADFISTLRAATDESYRVRREAADIAAAAAQASFNQDIEKERFKGQIAGELQTQRLGVDAQRALLEAKTRLQIAERNGQNITSIGSGENEMFLQTNPDNPNDPWVFKPGGFETTGPGGTTIVTTDAIPFSQLAGTAQ
jgi:hypothetical protein